MLNAEPQLREVLYGWQIFMIVVSNVIGITVFYGDGEALEVAGPSGVLLAFAVVGVTAICVMEGISEMVQMFPTPNANMEFVRVFVDEDLAWVVGVAYWYAYASTFAIQIVAAASFTEYWGFAQVYQTVLLYIVAPFSILFINFAGVFYFGWVETAGGVLKVCTVFGGGIFLYVIHGKSTIGSGCMYRILAEYSQVPKHACITDINEGFTNDISFASNPHIAGCYIMPIIAYAFVGIESVSVVAFEARDLKSLRVASQTLAYFIVALYLFCGIGEFLNVGWSDSALPVIYGATNEASVNKGQAIHNSRAIIIIAAFKAGYTRAAGFLNGCMIFSALSCSNTGLYLASRSLYGMTRKISPWRRLRVLKFLGSVWPKTGVPMWALFISFLAFYWLPFLQLHGGYAVSDLLEIMTTSASIACLLVWASQCLAFIRYWAWLRKHIESISQVYPEHDRTAETSQASTFLGGLQPAPAIIGLISSLTILLGFTTATWWSTPPTFRKIAVAYGAPVILATFFIALKVWTRRGYVKLDNDVVVLQRAIEYLKQPKRERESRGGQRDSDVEVTTWGANISDGNGQSPRSIQEGQEA